MRVLSVQQPWATLIVRGVKQIEIRSWTAAYKGRIAIHASVNTKWADVEKEWNSSSDVARCFAEQGWIDREDLKALPRAAILGTVELLGVHRCAAVKAGKMKIFDTDPVADVLETAVRDRVTGNLRAAPTPQRTLPMTIPDPGFVWAFARPHEVEPILDVPGQQHLWNAAADIAARLSEHEAQSKRGEWSATAVSKERKKESLEAWRAKWETDTRREAWTLMGETLKDIELEVLIFHDPQTEKWFRKIFRNYVDEHEMQAADGTAHIRIQRRLRDLFEGRATIPKREFELELRRLVHKAVQEDKTQEQQTVKFNRGLALLTELKAQSEGRPAEVAAIHKEVKALFRRNFLETLQEAELEDRVVEIRDG